MFGGKVWKLTLKNQYVNVIHANSSSHGNGRVRLYMNFAGPFQGKMIW